MAKITSKKSKAKTAGKAKKALAAEADLEAARHDIASAVTVEAHQVADHLRFEPGMRLADVDPAGSPGITGGKAEGRAALAAGVERLSSLQERLFAEGRGGGKRSLLLVVQGMDTSGKGGIMRHVVGAVDPQGVRQVAFKAPTAEERAHRFLWRITRELPQPGEIGVFDRSHYEDVLVVRVHGLVAKQVWSPPLRHHQPVRGRSGGRRNDRRQGDAAHLAAGAEGAPDGPTRRPGQVLEVQPRRRRRAAALGRLPGGVPGRADPMLDP
jgi:polyphosphate kinase 2 (PPK2 family)